MNTHSTFAVTLLLAACMVTAPSFADERKADFSVDAGIAYEYDSDVNIAQIDSSAGAADQATVLEAGVNAKIPFASRWTARAGYAYKDTAHAEFSEFDIGLHHASAQLGYRPGTTELALGADRYQALLDGNRFLELTQAGPSVSRLFGKKLFLRGAWTGTEKRYADLPERDAEGSAVRVDAYVLFDGMRHFVAVGYEQSNEDALDAEFDYGSSRSMLSYGKQTRLFSADISWKLSLQHENRAYDNVTEAIATARRDSRTRAGVNATIPLNRYLDVVAEIEKGRTESNLDSADVDKLTYRIGLSASF